MKRIITAALAISVIATNALAQTQPRPEHARLQSMAGRWNIDGVDSEGGKYTMTETCERFTGGFHMVCRREGKGAWGAMSSEIILGYDPIEKTYTSYTINQFGNAFFLNGTVNAQDWIWNGETRFEGELIRVRLTITEQSPNSCTFKMEGSSDGTSWMVADQGKATKVQ